MTRRLLWSAGVAFAITVGASGAVAFDLEDRNPEVLVVTRSDPKLGSAFPGGGSELVTPEVSVPEGARLTFVNLSMWGHSIYSDQWLLEDEMRLFNSEVIPFRHTSDVRGVANLSPGTYGFFCSNHMGMRGSLTVVPTTPREIAR